MEKYQTFTPRLLALIIDALIFFPLYFLDTFVKEASFLPAVFALWLLLSNAAHPVYSILMHGIYGQTLGKMALKVKVVDTSEKPITFHHAVLRELPYLSFNFSLTFFSMQETSRAWNENPFTPHSAGDVILYLMIGWMFLDVAVFFISDKCRALHDFIAGTVVVKTNV